MKIHELSKFEPINKDLIKSFPDKSISKKPFSKTIFHETKDEHDVNISESFINDEYSYVFSFLKKKFFPFKLEIKLTLFRKSIDEIK
jgi:hypothetical protein